MNTVVRESALKVDRGSGNKNPRPHRGLAPASASRLAFQSDALPTELSPLPGVSPGLPVSQSAFLASSPYLCYAHESIFYGGFPASKAQNSNYVQSGIVILSA